MRTCSLLILTAILIAAGCSRTSSTSESTPPDYIEVVGKGEAQGQGSGPVAWSQNMGAAIAANAEADVAAGGPEALMAARAASRRSALRKLAEQLGDAPLDAKTKLRDWLAGAPADQRMAFENLLEERATVAWREQGGKSVAVASIPTDAVVNWAMEHARTGGAAATDANALNESAYKNALEDARKKLKEELLKMDVGNGKTLGKVIEQNPGIGVQLDGVLMVVPVDEYKYPRVGTCEVKIFFDRNVARGLAAQGKRPGWWPF